MYKSQHRIFYLYWCYHCMRPELLSVCFQKKPPFRTRWQHQTVACWIFVLNANQTKYVKKKKYAETSRFTVFIVILKFWSCITVFIHKIRYSFYLSSTSQSWFIKYVTVSIYEVLPVFYAQVIFLVSQDFKTTCKTILFLFVILFFFFFNIFDVFISWCYERKSVVSKHLKNTKFLLV